MKRAITKTILLPILTILLFVLSGYTQPNTKILYKQIDSTALYMDIFFPENYDTSLSYPAIVFFFGGGWNDGKIKQFEPHAKYFSDRGAICCLPDYRVKSRHQTTPFESLKDAKSAIRYIREHAGEFHIDTSRIVAGGGSAGGHLAAATALIKDFNEENDNLLISCVPNALILFNPVIDNGPGGYGYESVGEQYKNFSPLHNILKGAPPTIFFLGIEDNLIPVETAKYFKMVMEKVGSRCDLFLYEGKKHGFFNYGQNIDIYNKTVFEADKFLVTQGFLMKGNSLSHSLNNSIKSKPNIIFFLADDMRYDAMGCAGNTIIHTPNLDALSKDGVRFNNAFVTTSVCCCSRASIFTGQYVSRHSINNFDTPLSEKAFLMTYPMLLKKSGYKVGFIGKYGIGKNTNSVENLFDYFWGTATQPKYENKDENGNYIHYTDMVNNHIDEFLETTDTDRPFCLSVSFKAPHVEDSDPRQFIYNPRFKGLYAQDVISEVPTNTFEEWEKFPAFFKENNEARKRWGMRFSNSLQYQESVKGYYRLISGLDEVIGNTREKLKSKGLEENTIIVFFSDNGFYLGEHGLAGKWYGHEPSIRVPFIIYNPVDKKNAGSVISDLVLNIDIAPTILSYAGVEIPESMQGEDVSPLINSIAKGKWRNSFYYEHMMKQFPTIPPSQGLRTLRYKYIIYPESNPVYEEMYDLLKDKYEVHNLAKLPEKQYLLELLRKQFKEQQKMISNKMCCP